MKILVRHDFDGLKNQNKHDFVHSGLSISNIAKEANFDVDETYILVQKLVAYHYLYWTDRISNYTVHMVMTTCNGYVEFKDGYKKHFKEILLGLAASSPFISLLIYLNNS